MPNATVWSPLSGLNSFQRCWSAALIAFCQRKNITVVRALAHALYSVRSRRVTLADLVEHDGFIALTSSLAIKPAALQRFLRGKPVVVEVDDVPFDPKRNRKVRQALSPEARAKRPAELPAQVGKVKTGLMFEVLRASGEAEATMAKALGLHDDNFAVG